MKHVIELPFTPPSLNVWQRIHWAKRLKIKREWVEYIRGLCGEVDKKIPRYEKVKLSAKLYFPDKHKRDTDNFSATLWKLVCDSLVNANVIPDDSSEYVQISTPELVFENRERTVIVIEGVDNGKGGI